MANSDASKKSYTVLHQEGQDFKQSKPPSPKPYRSTSINTATTEKSTNENRYRSTSFSNSIDQVIGFVQRKLSRTNDEEKQEFDGLEKLN